MNYGTNTATYTVVDIRKAFEGFDADIRMIARRTDKWSTDYVDMIFHDVINLAESKYLSKVSIALKNSAGTPIRATKWVVNESGTSISGDRAGGNDWPNLTDTYLSVTVEYTSTWHNLGLNKQNEFERILKFTWTPSTTDTNFPNLAQQTAQNYASNGYEVKKYNYQ